MYGDTDFPMITSTQCSCNGGGVTVEEGQNDVDALLVWISIDHREGLVWKLRDDLVNGEFHCFNTKGSNFGALGCVI